MHFIPSGTEEAGLAVVQSLNHELLVTRCEDGGKQLLRVIAVTADFNTFPFLPGFKSESHRETVAEVPYDLADIVLKITMDGEDFHILYGSSEGQLNELCSFDGRIINPEKVGCMTGTVVGMFASGNGTDSSNRAAFSFFELKQ